MSKVDFRAILSNKVGAIEKPKPLPVGNYAAVVDSWEPQEVGKNKTPAIRVNFRLTAPGENVDMDELEQVGGLPAVLKRKVNAAYWLTEDAMYRLREFMEDVCKAENTEDRSISEVMADCLQAPVVVVLKHRFTDKQEIVLEIDTVLPPEG